MAVKMKGHKHIWRTFRTSCAAALLGKEIKKPELKFWIHLTLVLKVVFKQT